MYRDEYHDWRRYPRLLLSAAGLDGACALAGVPGRFEVLDVSQGGARLLTEDHLPFLKQGQEVLCTFYAPRERPSLSEVAGIIRWREGGVLGIAFSQPLAMELHELRALFQEHP